MTDNPTTQPLPAAALANQLAELVFANAKRAHLIIENGPTLVSKAPSRPPSSQVWSRLAAPIVAQRGEMIGVHDSWIVATCIARDLTLITGNTREFNRVPGLAVENWIAG